MEKMETKALDILLNCKSLVRSLEEKFCRDSVMHKYALRMMQAKCFQEEQGWMDQACGGSG